MLALLADSSDVFGKIAAPVGVSGFDGSSSSAIGLIPFISTIIKLITIGAGLYVLFNIISAGLMLITASGDSSAPTKAKDQILHSVIGLAIIVFSYLIIALISLVFFGSATYILNPQLVGPAGP